LNDVKATTHIILLLKLSHYSSNYFFEYITLSFNVAAAARACFKLGTPFLPP
jgi:hypothetical protein